MVHFDVVTVFPDIIENYCNASIIGRARKAEKVNISVHDLRRWTTDKHRTVDDRVFGGGAGMLLKVAPIYQAIQSLSEKAAAKGLLPRVVATVASGELFNQRKAESMASSTDINYIILCGHYEGFDARVYEWVHEKLTIGPYILTGGELPALIVIDSVTRLIPGVLGNSFSAQEETTFMPDRDGIAVLGEHPQFTSPAVFNFVDNDGAEQTRVVPEVLRSGNHKKIAEENQKQRSKSRLAL